MLKAAYHKARARNSEDGEANLRARAVEMFGNLAKRWKLETIKRKLEEAGHGD